MRTAPSTYVVFASLPLFMLVETAVAAQCCLDPVRGYYWSDTGRCYRALNDPNVGAHGWPADPSKCTQPYCLDRIRGLAWRPGPQEFTCDRHKESQMISKEQYDALVAAGRGGQ
jgi:hypothetical protein